MNLIFECLSMWRRLGRMRSPKPSKQAMLSAWIALLRGAKRRPSGPPVVKLGTMVLHGFSWADLFDVYRDVWVSQAYHVELHVDDPFVIDCGANIGAATLYFALHQPRVRILAFEPNPVCAAIWRKNIAENGIRDADLVEAACGRSDGQVELHFSESGTLGSNLGDLWRDKSDHRTVQLVRLSRWINRRVDLLKIDVEGGEHEILEELVDSGAIAHVDRIALEYHHQLPEQRETLSQFLRTLEHAGFSYRFEAGLDVDSMYSVGFQGFMIYAVRNEFDKLGN